MREENFAVFKDLPKIVRDFTLTKWHFSRPSKLDGVLSVYSQYSVTTITANEALSVDGKHITKYNRERKSVLLYVFDKNPI